MAGFDGRCPHCHAKIEDIEIKWSGFDYASQFYIDCAACCKSVEITVHQVPEFETAKSMCIRCRKVEVRGEAYCNACRKHLESLR